MFTRRRLWRSGRLRALVPEPASSQDRLRRARELRADGDTGGAIAVLETALKEVPEKKRVAVHVELHRALVAHGEIERAERVLSSAAGRGNAEARSAWSRFDAGDRAGTRSVFGDVLRDILHGGGFDDWLQAFDLATGHSGVEHLSDDRQTCDSIVREPVGGSITDEQVYAVSGMGWSGSGAVFDYLRGFAGVESVVGESRLLEGRYGVPSLMKEFGADDGPESDFGAALVNFFRYTLVGFAPCHDYEEFRHVRNSRRYVEGPGGAEYAAACVDYLRDVCAATPEERRHQVLRSLPGFMSAAVRSRLVDRECVPILDNVLHVANLPLAVQLPAWTLFATVRDPRDQYVDNMRNNPSFGRNVKAFVRRYRLGRRTLDELQVSGCKNVRVVQFESFVRDGELRNVMADELGLSKSRRRPPFDPSASMKNIGLWTDTPHRSEVEFIAEQLPEYLVE